MMHKYTYTLSAVTELGSAPDRLTGPSRRTTR